SREVTARRHGRDAVVAMQRAMFATLDEIERVLVREEIDCDWARGGTVLVATIPAHLRRLRAELKEDRAWGFSEDHYRELPAPEQAALAGLQQSLAALSAPHGAPIHPAKRDPGLARAVERRGARLHEHTPVTAIEPGRLVTTRGTVRADFVVRATE